MTIRTLLALWATPAVVATAAAPAPAQPNDDARIAWLRENATVVRSINYLDEDFADLEPLKAAIGDARVVLLGEQTHGDGATFAAKSRLVRFLHQEMGFDVLAYESGLHECDAVDRAFAQGRPVEEAHALGVFGIWSLSQQARPALEYARSTHGTDRPLTVAGVDSQITTDPSLHPLKKGLEPFFDAADPRMLGPRQRSAVDELLAWFARGDRKPRQAPPDELLEAVRSLADLIDANRGKLDAAHGAAEVALVERSIRNLLAYAAQIAASPMRNVEEGNIRDAAMGENLAWLARERYPDRKIMVWAASAHNAWNVEALEPLSPNLDYTGVRPMGQVAREALGDEIYSIMFLAYEGRIGRPWSGPFPIERAPDGSLEDLMHRTGRPYLFLDLRGAPEGHWLREKHVARPLGYAPLRAAWPDICDAFFFTDRMYPSTRIGVEPADAMPRPAPKE